MAAVRHTQGFLYTHCHICGHDLGRNAAVAHMRVGARLAYDVERGRLWVVCPRCGEWNLTPLEERWEAIDECESLFVAPETRASSANISLCHARGVDLVRIGPALRDELANWRYGARFESRHRDARFLTRASAIAALGGVGGLTYVGVATGALAMTLWSAALVGTYVAFLAAPLGRRIGPLRDARLFDTNAHEEIRLSFTELRDVLIFDGGTRAAPALGVKIERGFTTIAELRGNDALVALGAILPRVNWQGARPALIRHATELVDRAEAQCRHAEAGKGRATDPWTWIALTQRSRLGIATMPLVARMALEMAATEELERQAMVGEAHVLGARWLEAETVAGIADDLLLPPSIGDWIRRHRPKT